MKFLNVRKAEIKEANLKDLPGLIQTCGFFREVFESVFEKGLDDDQMVAFLSQFDLEYVCEYAKESRGLEVGIYSKSLDKFNEALSAGLSFHHEKRANEPKEYSGKSLVVYEYYDVHAYREKLSHFRSSLLSCRSILIERAVKASTGAKR